MTAVAMPVPASALGIAAEGFRIKAWHSYLLRSLKQSFRTSLIPLPSRVPSVAFRPQHLTCVLPGRGYKGTVLPAVGVKLLPVMSIPMRPSQVMNLRKIRQNHLSISLFLPHVFLEHHSSINPSVSLCTPGPTCCISELQVGVHILALLLETPS